MLTRCNLNLDQNPYGEVESQKVQELIAKEFPDAKDAVVVVETITYATLIPLSKLKLAEVLPSCQRLVISTPTAELRMEIADKGFAYRILRESAGDTYVKREDLLIMRDSPHLDDGLYAQGKGRMCVREYYQENADGMYVFVAERLAGSTKGGD